MVEHGPVSDPEINQDRRQQQVDASEQPLSCLRMGFPCLAPSGGKGGDGGRSSAACGCRQIGDEGWGTFDLWNGNRGTGGAYGLLPNVWRQRWGRRVPWLPAVGQFSKAVLLAQKTGAQFAGLQPPVAQRPIDHAPGNIHPLAAEPLRQPVGPEARVLQRRRDNPFRRLGGDGAGFIFLLPPGRHGGHHDSAPAIGPGSPDLRKRFLTSKFHFQIW